MKIARLATITLLAFTVALTGCAAEPDTSTGSPAVAGKPVPRASSAASTDGEQVPARTAPDQCAEFPTDLETADSGTAVRDVAMSALMPEGASVGDAGAVPAGAEPLHAVTVAICADAADPALVELAAQSVASTLYASDARTQVESIAVIAYVPGEDGALTVAGALQASEFQSHEWHSEAIGTGQWVNVGDTPQG